MISLQNVTKSFGGIDVLKNVSFQIDRGESVSLIGPGGCGKTTVLKIILGLTKPQEGDVNLLGTDMIHASENTREDTLKRLGMAFQQGGLFDFMTVKENLMFAMKHMTNLSQSEMDQRVKSLLAEVKLGKTEQMYPFELSGGMKRRVGIARALCNDPQVAIFDEPTSGLDPVTSTIILNMIKDLGSRNPDTSMLVATTNVEIAMRFSQRIIVLKDSSIVADGKWRDLLLDGPEWVQHFLRVRIIGLDREYVELLDLPKKFIDHYW